jgi:hypothetical protein
VARSVPASDALAGQLCTARRKVILFVLMASTGWRLFDTAPKDGRVFAAIRNLNARPLHPKRSGVPFKWDRGRQCWLQRIGKHWHMPFFEPTHWSDRRPGNYDMAAPLFDFTAKP